MAKIASTALLNDKFDTSVVNTILKGAKAEDGSWKSDLYDYHKTMLNKYGKELGGLLADYCR